MSTFLGNSLNLLERLSERDRAALMAALVVVAIGLDMLVVMPMSAQRHAMVAGMAATAEGAQQVVLDAEKLRQAELLNLNQRKALIEKDLAAFGLNNALKDSLSFMLSRTLRNQAVTIRGLRSQSVEEIKLDAQAAPAEATATGSTEEQHPPLYRHRYELVLHSDLKQVGPTLDALEHGTRPLRLESAHLQALPSGEIELTVVLVTIGLEKTWLAL